MRRTMMAALLMTAIATPAYAQLGSILKKSEEAKKQYDDLTITEDEERQIGEDISAKLREKYGVVQDKAVHKYVALAGSALALNSSRPGLKWTFVVLDTDGVNAFAAPGGFVHVTRGALALMQNEAELADVLGHEIGHVTKKHTINAIKKGNYADAIGKAANRKEALSKITDAIYEMTLENKFDRDDEKQADEIGMTLAGQAGYAPTGLSAFLTRLAERNKDQKERSGIFASHQETKARLSDISKFIAATKLTAAHLVAARFSSNISYKPVPISAVAQVAPPTPGAAPAADKPASTGGKFGMAGLSGLGSEKSGTQTVSSAGSRGLNPDRDAKGGPVKTLVVVTVSAAELAEFKKGIAG
jgi:predicted Zn-dependent protease